MAKKLARRKTHPGSKSTNAAKAAAKSQPAASRRTRLREGDRGEGFLFEYRKKEKTLSSIEKRLMFDLKNIIKRPGASELLQSAITHFATVVEPEYREADVTHSRADVAFIKALCWNINPTVDTRPNIPEVPVEPVAPWEMVPGSEYGSLCQEDQVAVASWALIGWASLRGEPKAKALMPNLPELIDGFPNGLLCLVARDAVAFLKVLDEATKPERIAEWRARSRVKISSPLAGADEPIFTHADDFTWIIFNGQKYDFAKGKQAESIRVLWESWDKGKRQNGCGLSEKTIGQKCDSASNNFRLAQVFRDHPAWGTIIRRVSKGVFALCAESQKNPTS